MHYNTRLCATVKTEKTLWQIGVMAVLILQVGGSFDVRCPVSSQWDTRAKHFCNESSLHYSCLYDSSKQQFTEACDINDIVGPGNKFTRENGLKWIQCENDRYQPFIFKTEESSNCILLKSTCSGEGQIIHNNGSTLTDRRCRCDYIDGYSFILKPIKKCFCDPTEEDCTCVKKQCSTGEVLNPDYNCTRIEDWNGNFYCPELERSKRTDIFASTTQKNHHRELKVIISTMILVSYQCLETRLDAIWNKSFIDVPKSNYPTIEVHKTLPSRSSVVNFSHISDLGKAEDEIIKEWKEVDKMVVPRRPMKMIMNQIEKKGKTAFCVIGLPGSGKSTIIHNIALQLQNDYGYTISIATSPLDITKRYDLYRTVFVVDDIYGKFTFDSKLFDNWNEKAFAIKNILGTADVKILASSRSFVFKNLPFHTGIFTDSTVNLFSPEYALSDTEIKNIARQYLPEYGKLHIFDNIDNLEERETFPLLCKLHQILKPDEITRLSDILRYMKSEFESSDFFHDCIISLFVISDNKVSDNMSYPSNKLTFLNEFFRNERECPSWNQLEKQIKHFSNVLFKRSRNNFTTIHDEVFDTLVSHVGSLHCDLLVKYASPTVIRERFHLESVGKKMNEKFINIPFQKEELYLNRLCLDIKQHHTDSVFTNRLLIFRSFRSKFLQFVKNDEKACSTIKDLQHNTSSPLLLCSLQGYPDIVDWLIGIFEEESRNITDEAGRSSVYLSAEYNHIETTKMLLAKHVDCNRCRQDRSHSGESPLFVASFKGYTKIVRELLTFKANPNLCNYNGCSALHAASSRGFAEIVKLLLEHGANTSISDSDNNTPLHKASENGHINTVKLLIAYNANVNILNIKHQTPLYLAVCNRHEETVNELLYNKANPNLCDDAKMTPLYIASTNGYLKTVEQLLENKANPNLTALFDRTPLIIATEKGYTDIVKCLLKNRAHPDSCGFGNISPLHVATKSGNIDIVDILLAHGANPNISSSVEHTTPLYAACSMGNFKIVELLLNHDCEINITDSSQRSPLYVACRDGNFDIVNILLKNDAEPNISSAATKTPLYIASLYGFLDIVEILLEHNADPNVVSLDHETALYGASKEGHNEIVKKLLHYGALTNVIGARSPLQAATDNGHTGIVDILNNSQSSSITYDTLYKKCN